MNGNNVNIGYIFEYMSKNNLSKNQFCKLCGIGTTTFDRIVRGENFGIKSLLKIMKVIEIDIDYLFNKKERRQ